MLSWSQIVDACRYCHIIQVHKTLLQLMSKWNIQLQTTANTTKTSFLNPKSFFFKSKSRQQKGQAVTDSDSIMCELIAKTISLNGYAHLRKSQLTSKFHLHIAPHASLQDNLSHCCTCSIPCTWIKWVYWHQKKDEYIYIYIYIPWMWWALDRFLTILPPWILIWRNICNLVADCRHLDWSFHPMFPVNKL